MSLRTCVLVLRSANALQEVEDETRDAKDSCFNGVFLLEIVHVIADSIVDDFAKLSDLLWGGAVYKGDDFGEMVVVPASLDDFRELLGSEVTQPGDLLFDCHGKDFGMSEGRTPRYNAFRRGWCSG